MGFKADSDDRIVAASIALAAVHTDKWSAMLPPAKREGPDTIARATVAQVPIKLDYTAEVLSGAPKFAIAIGDGLGAKATLGSNPAGDGGDAAGALQLLQKVTSPEVSISNPTEGKIAVAKIQMEWKQVDGNWTSFGYGNFDIILDAHTCSPALHTLHMPCDVFYFVPRLTGT